MRLALAFALLAGCSQPSAAPAASDGKSSAGKRVTLVASSEIWGTPEPCGCQSDPLGDVARVVTLGRGSSEEGPALWVDAGSLRYNDQPISSEKKPQAELKARFLEQTLHDAGAIVGLGPTDLRFGPADVPPKTRLAANVQGVDLAPPIVRDVGGVKVGVFAVLSPTVELPAGVTASDPIAAAKATVASLQQQHAQAIVALVHGTRAETKRLAHTVPGITVAVVGHDVGDDGGQAELSGDTIVLQPANQAQRVARVTFVLDGAGKISTKLFGGADERKARLARIASRSQTLRDEIAQFSADPAVDLNFLQARDNELKSLAEEKQRLESTPLTPPPPPYAVASLLPVNRKLTRDDKTAAAMKQLDAQVGEANRAAGEKVPVPAAAPGEPRYVGVETCDDCHAHEDAVAFWKTTVHAKAWQELVAVDKQWSFDCIKCHTTGFGERGGSAMAHVDGLEAVQCEVCHGPGSLHAAKPKQVKVPTPSPGKELCLGCHTPEHSDTFQYEAYLRDVLGPAHGAKKRLSLGPGATGHELRAAAIAKAKATDAVLK